MPRVLMGKMVVAPVLLLLVVGVAYLGSFGGEATDQAVIAMLLNLIIVIATYTFAGNSGVISFGHVALVLIGAYVAGLLTVPVFIKVALVADMPLFLAQAQTGTAEATILGGVGALIFGGAFALALMRLSGLAAGLGTVAMLLTVNVVASNWAAVTHGTAGLGPVPLVATREVVLVWVGVSIAIAYIYQESSFGIRLRASREDEIAARAAGVVVARERWIAFTLSSFLAGIAGALYAQYFGVVSPDSFYLRLTFVTIAMLVIGGFYSLTGAVVGTLVVSVISELLRYIEQGISVGALQLPGRPGLSQLVLALLMLLILLRRPDGLTAGKEIDYYLRRWLPLRPDRDADLAVESSREVSSV